MDILVEDRVGDLLAKSKQCRLVGGMTYTRVFQEIQQIPARDTRMVECPLLTSLNDSTVSLGWDARGWRGCLDLTHRNAGRLDPRTAQGQNNPQ